MPAALRTSLPSLAFWLLVSFTAGAVGAVASTGSAEFYLGLARPAWAPPAWLFAPVWTVLYCLMGVSAWLVWRERRLEDGPLPYVLFFAQLLLNALWTWIFFAWQEGRWAFIEILCLVVLISATLITFSNIKPLAGWLLAPYLAWVCFASALTLSLWQLNPGFL
jgi:benzodiazapine receptor